MATECALPAFFPIVLPGCESVADALFTCLNSKTETMGDPVGARTAITACKAPQGIYSKCIRRSLNDPKAKKPIVLTEWEAQSSS
jgi:hypothetical protein